MIASLKGKVQSFLDEALILEVNQVGYELYCSQSSLSQFEGMEEVFCHVYTHVREDAIQLFGFSSLQEKKLFLSLIKVSGIGPKVALGILSATPVERILEFIDQGDVGALSKLPKIGKKKAEQIVLALKDKLKFVEEESLVSKSRPSDEIKSALIHLGFKAQEVEKVVSQLNPGLTLQEGVRQGLAALTQI
ncbi:MAG: Holliday junction branch migration protein RuvA [Bdellovibrionales bacterium]|nr:Holliday junction branch migration protein RuvA [Bdellovibrionales bacterium]